MLLILYILISESLLFFSSVSLTEFLTDTRWTPLFTNKHYGILPLLSGTLLTTGVAIITAVPVGLIIAIYLNFYVSIKVRNILKPCLEVLAAIPTVIYGFFALIVVTPILKYFLPDISSFNSLSAGLVMGLMIVPMISSLTDDALDAVPKSVHYASYGLGANRFQTAFKVVLPAAYSGFIISIILALSRAIGETMIVAIAAGQQPRFTANPLVPVETITAYIVQVSTGDVPYGSLEYKTIYAAGIALFVFTFLLNSLSFVIRKKLSVNYV